jgi:hypothetical protein
LWKGCYCRRTAQFALQKNTGTPLTAEVGTATYQLPRCCRAAARGAAARGAAARTRRSRGCRAKRGGLLAPQAYKILGRVRKACSLYSPNTEPVLRRAHKLQFVRSVYHLVCVMCSMGVAYRLASLEVSSLLFSWISGSQEVRQPPLPAGVRLAGCSALLCSQLCSIHRSNCWAACANTISPILHSTASFREWTTAGGKGNPVLVSGSLLLLLSCYHSKK